MRLLRSEKFLQNKENNQRREKVADGMEENLCRLY